MLLVDARVADDLALQGKFRSSPRPPDIRHPPFDDLRRKSLCHRVNVIAAPETVPWLGQIQSGATPCPRRTPILLHWSILYLGSCLTTCSMRLVRIVEVRIIKTPERREYRTKV